MAFYEEKVKQETDKYMICFEKERKNKLHHDKTIKNELEKLGGLNDEILEQCDIIYRMMLPATKRGNNRVKLKTYILTCALQELLIPYNPITIANLIPSSNENTKSKSKKKKVKTKRKINYLAKSGSIFSPIQTAYEPPFVAYDPRYFIYVFGLNCQLTIEICQEIVKFATKILSKCPDMFSDAANKIAVGMIYYYTSTKGINLNSETIGEISGLSPATMSDIYNKICSIDCI